jgi:ribonuclease P protein component
MQRPLRLRQKEDFARLRNHGRVWRHHLLIVSVRPNGLTHNRYGFITSKHLGRAVVRNRTRRLMRESVRHAHPQLKTGHDLAFIARQLAVGQPFQAVQEAVMTVLTQAGLWQPSPGETPS